MKLKYFVYKQDFNNKEIVKYNIFDNDSLCNEIIKYRKQFKDNFQEFSEAVRKLLMYRFWSKSEYEIILTSWPPYVENEEIDRLITERNEHNRKYPNTFKRNSTRLTVAEKIDIYDQIMLNWDIFINYVWENIIEKR